MRKLAASMLALMSCACAAQVDRHIPVVPQLPPPPVNTERPIGPPMLPWLECLQTQGWQSCRGINLSPSPANTTSTAAKP